MGFRFRKSVNLGGGLRINASKSGLGVSAGFKGARIGIGPRGIRKTVSLPGTGLSYVSESGFKTSSNKNKYSAYQKESEQQITGAFSPQKVSGGGWMVGVFIGVFTLLFNQIVGALIMLVCSGIFLLTQRNPLNKSAVAYNQGFKAYSKGDFDNAETSLLKSLEFSPNNAAAHLVLGAIYHDYKNDLKKAIEHFKEYVNIDPSDRTARYSLALSYFQLGKYDDAIPLLQSLSFEDVPDVEHDRIITLGRCFYEKGQYELAAEQFKKGPVNKRKMDDQVMEAKYWLGLAYLKNGDKAKAKTQLARIYSEDTTFMDVEQYVDDLGLLKGAQEC